MSDLRIVPVDGDVMLREWRHVHNVIVPPDELSLDEVRERGGRHQLRNAYAGDALVGCSTVRPPEGDEGVATVIARVLPEYRGRGFGSALYEDGLTHARVLGAREIRTVVLTANGDGLRFAEKRGFVEVDRYVAPEDENEVWLTLRLAGYEVSGA
ncbi:acetyltransferase [Streptomyces viridochromogenes]|uniref:Acetyltransferase n=1 Tax=Streptomyces viridochromogenes TaxID=1938 RepID=A0A0J7ZFV3_STRVR|nr:GNAT family N-acetyltransferase [Streptomyces viridochromogenes]KMS74759.1 acetyltransferase [Streptomyces viridochromogenes]KOG14818.1 acetyltransferase [Streptomyces viridochromogenes]KOG15012.1 acetyltransferase [Streptomyces viridochromogenes]